MRSDINAKARYWKYYLKRLKYKDVLPENPMHDDIYLVEYPKSGVTWLSFLLGSIELQLADIQNEYLTFYNAHKYIIDIHQVRYSEINRILHRTFIKTHSEFNPYYYFVIYLIRNPVDVMVSYYNFMCDHGYLGTFEKFVRDKKFGVLHWKKHVNSWYYKKSDDQRMHFIRYEDLLLSTDVEIKKIYRNLGVNLNSDIVAKAVENSSLNFMKGSEKHYSSNNLNYTVSFVGKTNKKLKKDILTKNVEEYIYSVAFDELERFYPEMARDITW